MTTGTFRAGSGFGSRFSKKVLPLLCLMAALASPECDELVAGDWPTWQHDNRRSGFSSEQIDAVRLTEEWVWQSPFPPQPAWHGPAKWDAYANLRDLPSMRSYDLVFHTTCVGDSLFFGSSADDAVRCLDVRDGTLRWSYTAEGPVRIAPTVADGRLYFGADDGYARCLDAETGRLIWKFRPVEPGPLILNNGRLISSYPCRTGVLVDEGVARFACGLLPWKQAYYCSVKAQTGRLEGAGTFVRKLNGKTLEGAPAMSSELVLFPQGRVAPLAFRRSDGQELGAIKKSGGGSIVVVSLDSKIFHGPATDSRKGGIAASDPKSLEMVAAYGRGSALIVNERVSYMLVDDELVASDLATRKVLFRVPCELQLALAGASDVVFAGGEDAVAAFDMRTGKRLWEAIVGGKVYGLSVASGRLFVSTDTGAVYSFRPDRAGASAEASPDVEGETALLKEPPVVADASPEDLIDDKHLLGHWLFRSKYAQARTVRNLAGGLPGRTKAGAVFEQTGTPESLAFDGSSQSVLIAPSHRQARMPRRELSVECWVRVDSALEWGGLVGAVQDNGDFERGWVLGFRQKRFSFALAGTEGNNRLTYLTAKTEFVSGQWYHVAASYDGVEMCLFVNGQLENTSSQQRGEIHYPPQAFFEIGSYHDKDEDHRLRGAIHEVRVYDDVRTPEEIAADFSAKADAFPQPRETIELPLGPWLRFTSADSAVISWRTDEPSETHLELTRTGSHADRRVFRSKELRLEHSVTLSELKRNRQYSYRIQARANGKAVETTDFECDTFFNYEFPSYSTNEDESTLAGGRGDSVDSAKSDRAAREILRRTKIDRGIAAVVGLDDGGLVRSLVRESSLRVICFDDDAARVAAVQQSLVDQYGVRVAVHHVTELDRLPVVGHFANLVTTERSLAGGLPESGREPLRILRPDGGFMVVGGPYGESSRLTVGALQTWCGDAHSDARIAADEHGTWAVVRRGPLPGAGDWTHLYGRPDNSAFGGESLGGARATSDLAVQWIGRPGPRYQADRSGRKPSPLAAGGRLFLQGLDRIVAVDSFNGTILWSLEIPGFHRFNVARDSSNWCADRHHVFAVVGDHVWQIDAASGNVLRFHSVEEIDRANWQTDWGFVARTGNHLIGSAVKAGTAWREYWGKGGWHDARSGESTYQVCSDRLFARSVEDGASAWSWSKGVILNPSITIANGRTYFVECREPEIVDGDERRIGSPKLWRNQYLVALDSNTGSLLWEKPIDTVDGNVAFYMAQAKERLVVVSSSEKQFHVYAYSDDDGTKLWEQKVGWINGKGDHGKAMSRPAIVGDRVFVRPQVLSLSDGTVLDLQLPGGGCGTYACTSEALFFRSGEVTVWDADKGSATKFPRLRPDCWLSTIPADGMLLSPEGGGGCSCGSWMETSIGFMPRQHRSRSAMSQDVERPGQN